jgi:hypothetical protein
MLPLLSAIAVWALNNYGSDSKLKIMLPSATVTIEEGSRQISPENQKRRTPSGSSLFDLS